MTGTEAPHMAGLNPYVGPRPFEVGETLYGRKSEIADLYYLLSAERIVLLYSPSGAGKTSLVQSGLIPRLRDGFDVWRPTRLNQEPSVLKAGGSDVNRYTLSALAGWEEGIPAKRRRPVKELAGESLAEYAAKRPRRPSAPESVVLIFDQFEEVLTVDPLAEEAKREFFDQLGELLRNHDFWALFVLREEYLAPLDPYARQVPTQLKNRFRIDLLGLDAAREAIVMPAQTSGREFPAVEILVHDLATTKRQQVDGSFKDATGRHVEPVHLQVVCRRLWERMPADDLSIDAEDLEQFGDVTEALAAYYDDSIEELVGASIGAQESAIRRWFEDHLITESGIRKPVLRGRGKSAGLGNEIIEMLLGRHLIRAEQRTGATWYELVHDRFIDPIKKSNRKWFRRLQRRRLVVACVAAALLAVLGLASYLRQNLLNSAEAVSERALDILEDHPPRSLWVALEAAETAYTVDRRLTSPVRKALRQALQESRARLIRTLKVGDVEQLTLDRPGNRLSILHADGRLSVWEIGSGLKLWTVNGGDEPIGAAVLSSDGARLAAFEADGEITLWSVDSQNKVSSFAVDTDPLELEFSADGSYLASTDLSGTVSLWETSNGQKVLSLSDPDGSYIDTVFRPGGRRFATASDTSNVQVWLPDENEPRLTLAAGADPIVAFSPNGQILVSVNASGTALLWDYGAGGPPWRTAPERDRPEITNAPTQEVSLDPEGRRVTLISTYGTVRSWDLRSNATTTTLQGDEEWLAVAAFSRDGRRLARSTAFGQIEVWELIFEEVPRILSGHGERINAIVAGPQARLLASGSDDQTARVWDPESGRIIETLDGHGAPVNGVAFSPDQRRLATASDDNTARIWDLESGRLAHTLAGHSNTVTAVDWGPDGALIATASTDGTARVWNADDGDLRLTLHHPGESVRALAFSPDGTLLATTGGIAEEETGTVRIWDAHSGLEIADLSNHSDLVNAVAFNPGGDLLATGSDDKTARIWKIRSGEELFRLLDHSGTVTGVTFAPDGKRLATCDVNGTIILWDVVSGEEDFTIPGSIPIRDIAFTSDGKRLVKAGDDALIRLEPLTAEDLIRLAEERTGAEPMVQVKN